MAEMDARAASHWWALGEGAMADAIWQHVNALEQRERNRIARDQVNEAIYSSNVGAGGGRRGDLLALFRTLGFQAADLNFTRQIVDALVARIGNNQPAIRVPADGADWGQRQQAKLLDKVIGGEMEQLDIQAEAPLALRAALVTRAGALKVVAHNGDIVADRIPVDEFRVDSREARYGKPRQMHHVKQVAREVLIRDFPDHAGAIRNAEVARKRMGELGDVETGIGGETNMLDVTESWHLPSHKDADDGVRVISIREQVLVKEPWKRPRFPVAWIRWSPPQRGFWGCSLVDELAALQFKVNEIARDLMENIYFTSAVKVITRRGADINKKRVPGKHPHFIEVDNPGDIAWEAPDGFSPAQFQFLQWLIQQMYEVSGVSQLMAQSKNPLGAGASGAALSEFYDIESERFSQLELSYARLWRDTGALIIDAAKDLSEDKGFQEREVKWVRRSVIERVKWSDVNTGHLDDDRYQIRLEAAGYLPKTRSGKMQAIEQLIANGFLDPKWAPAMLDFPDLEQANMIRNAPVEYAIACMGDVLDCEIDEDGDVIEDKSAVVPTPDPDADLQLLMDVAKALKLQQLAEKSPRGVIERCALWCTLVDAALTKGAPAPQAMPADPAMMGAPGMAPPMDPGMAPMGPPPGPPMAGPPGMSGEMPVAGAGMMAA
jgi:hypothetical protein